MIRFTVVGMAKAQARPRVFTQANGQVRAKSEKTSWYWVVYHSARENAPAIPLDGPLHMSIVFRLPRPQNAKKDETWAWKKPDIDNLAKAVMDACSNARIWQDDARIVSLNLEKRLGPPDGAQICICAMDEAARVGEVKS